MKKDRYTVRQKESEIERKGDRKTLKEKCGEIERKEDTNTVKERVRKKDIEIERNRD